MNTIRKIFPGLFHWTTYHEEIGEEVHSYHIAAPRAAVLVDPRVPEEGIDWFGDSAPPEHIYLTNRLHYRHSDRFSRAFGAIVWCHRAGLHHFGAHRDVRGFDHGDILPCGIQALEVDALCPEETAFYWPAHGGAIFVGDAIVRHGDALAFVPDALMGDDPARVKKGLCAAFERHLLLAFDTILFAHGEPWVGHGSAALAGFLALATSSSSSYHRIPSSAGGANSHEQEL